MMPLCVLGIEDPWVWSAYLLSVLSAAICLGYGIWRWNWNPPAEEPLEEVKRWSEEEDKVEQEL